MLLFTKQRDTKDKNDLSVEVSTLKSDLETGSEKPEVSEMKRGLNARHLQFIALCGSIGTALFVGTGTPLVTCGPAPLFTLFLIVSTAVYFVMNYLAEMACWLPTKGLAPANFVTRYAETSMGFACGWTYWYSYAILVPVESTAAGLVLQYWVSDDTVPIGVWIAVFWVVMVGINLIAVQFYGESEFFFGVIKLSCIIGLIIVGFVIFFGGGPEKDRVGFRYWQDPGSFALHLVPEQRDTARFLDTWTAIIRSSLAFVLGPELIITSGGETQNPRRNIAKASRRFIYRLLGFYILGTFIITVTVPYNDPNLVGGVESGASGSKASPFVAGIQNAGIPVLNHIVNGVIFSSALSSGTSFLYASSRCLVGLAREGSAPKLFLKVNRLGVPYYSVGLGALIGLLGFLNVSSSSQNVFNWLTNIVTVGGFFCWVCTGIAYLRWRKAIAFNGLQNEVPFKSILQPYGAWFAVCFFSIVALTNGYEVFFNWDVANFFAAYITFPFFFILYFVHKIWYRTPWLFKIEDIDILGGQEFIEEEEEEVKAGTWYGKVGQFLF